MVVIVHATRRPSPASSLKPWLAVLALAALASLAVSCDMGQKTQNKGGDTVHVASVSLDQATRKILYGDSYKLTATILPSNAADKSLAWESSDDTVATVTSEGLVTAVAAGSAAISVKTADGNKTDSCSVTVPAGSVEVSVQ